MTCNCDKKVTERFQAGGVVIKVTGPHNRVREMIGRISNMTSGDGFAASSYPVSGSPPPPPPHDPGEGVAGRWS